MQKMSNEDKFTASEFRDRIAAQLGAGVLVARVKPEPESLRHEAEEEQRKAEARATLVLNREGV